MILKIDKVKYCVILGFVDNEYEVIRFKDKEKVGKIHKNPKTGIFDGKYDSIKKAARALVRSLETE